MSGAIPLLPLYDSTAWIRKTFLFHHLRNQLQKRGVKESTLHYVACYRATEQKGMVPHSRVLSTAEAEY